MNIIPQRSFVLESRATPEEACTRLRYLLDAPKPACEYCGQRLPQELTRYCESCGHPFPGKSRLEGTVCSEGFQVRFSAVTGILVVDRTPDLDITGRFEATPPGTQISVSIQLSFWDFVLTIPGFLVFIIFIFMHRGGAQVAPFLIIVFIALYMVVTASFQSRAKKVQELLTVLLSPEVFGETPSS